MKRSLLACLTAVALLLTLSACDSNGSSDDDGNGNGNNSHLGTYSASVTGAASQELSGTAVASGTSAQTGWGLALGGTTGDFVVFAAPGSDRPTNGTYPVIPYADAGSIEPDKFIASLTLQGGSAVYTSTGGTIEITSSSSSRVEGTFSFTAVGFQDEIVTVSGIFDAINAGG